jgi:hypothetical protein
MKKELLTCNGANREKIDSTEEIPFDILIILVFYSSIPPLLRMEISPSSLWIVISILSLSLEPTSEQPYFERRFYWWEDWVEIIFFSQSLSITAGLQLRRRFRPSTWGEGWKRNIQTSSCEIWELTYLSILIMASPAKKQLYPCSSASSIRSAVGKFGFLKVCQAIHNPWRTLMVGGVNTAQFMWCLRMKSARLLIPCWGSVCIHWPCSAHPLPPPASRFLHYGCSIQQQTRPKASTSQANDRITFYHISLKIVGRNEGAQKSQREDSKHVCMSYVVAIGIKILRNVLTAKRESHLT